MSTRTAAVIVIMVLVAIGVIAYLITSEDSSPESVAVEDIKWYGFDEGAALARQNNKKILIDVYTDWCIWCKKMDKEVYTNEEVSKAIASHFVGVKLNAESSKGVTFNGEKIDEARFARTLNVTGYPTIVFLDPAAQPITKLGGFMDAKEFVKALRYIGEDHYKTKSYQEFKSTK